MGKIRCDLQVTISLPRLYYSFTPYKGKCRAPFHLSDRQRAQSNKYDAHKNGALGFDDARVWVLSSHSGQSSGGSVLAVHLHISPGVSMVFWGTESGSRASLRPRGQRLMHSDGVGLHLALQAVHFLPGEVGGMPY